MNNVILYLREVIKKWYVIVSFVLTLLDLSLYFGLSIKTISIEYLLYIIVGFIIISSYNVWLYEKKKNKDLEDKLRKGESKKPKLKLFFSNGKEELIINNKIFERKISKKLVDSESNEEDRTWLKEMGESPIIKEIYEEFIPIIFRLDNIGDFKSTDIRVDISLPKEIICLENLPQKNWWNFDIPLFTRKDNFTFLQNEKSIRLTSKKLMNPDHTEFEKIYLSATKEGKFALDYTINCAQLKSDEIRGELFIHAKPLREVKEYSKRELLEADKKEYDELIKNQLKEDLD